MLVDVVEVDAKVIFEKSKLKEILELEICTGELVQLPEGLKVNAERAGVAEG